MVEESVKGLKRLEATQTSLELVQELEMFISKPCWV